MHLGEPTLVAVTAFLFVIWALRGAMIWRVQRNYPGHSRWTAAGLLILAAMCLFNMWPLTSGGLFIAAANTMVVIAPILYLEGAREFRGLPPRNWLAYAACAAVIAAVFYFDYAAPNLHLRVYFVSSFMGIVLTLASIQLLKGSAPGHRRRAVFTGCMFALCGAVIVARALYFYWAHPSDNSPSGNQRRVLRGHSGIGGRYFTRHRSAGGRARKIGLDERKGRGVARHSGGRRTQAQRSAAAGKRRAFPEFGGQRSRDDLGFRAGQAVHLFQ